MRPAYPNEILLSPKENSQYRLAIGSVYHLAVCTRPDVPFQLSALARNLHAPTARHMVPLKRFLRNVSGTLIFGLSFPRHRCFNPTELNSGVDADWGGCNETRRSTTGFDIAVNEAPTYWRSKQQTVISLSSAESEYIALYFCAKELW